MKVLDLPPYGNLRQPAQGSPPQQRIELAYNKADAAIQELIDQLAA
jgi:hypothetical protein